MATQVKIARTAKELDDVFWLRHHVYVVEEGKFSSNSSQQQRLSDYFDALPGTVNIIAYNKGEPVGTLRINRDVGKGLPVEEYFDFQSYWQEILTEDATLDRQVALASGGMLAIRSEWRGRRDVILALFKLATGILYSWGTHSVVATVNYQTVSIYERAGFYALSTPQWVETIGNYIVPMVAPCSLLYRYTFGNLQASYSNLFWLDTFADQFKRILLQPGEILFSEGDIPCDAFIIVSGLMTISRQGCQNQSLILANLARGDLFGELALIDEQPRSATAYAQTNVELIALDRMSFSQALENSPKIAAHLLKTITDRMRRTDHLAVMMAYSPLGERIKYVLEHIRTVATVDRKRPDTVVVKLGCHEVAKLSGVQELDVRQILDIEQQAGRLEYSDRMIRFLN